MDPVDESATLAPKIVFEVIAILTPLLEHVQYAVCGISAMLTYGFDDRLPTHISIVSPRDSKEVVRAWCLANAECVEAIPGLRHGFGVRTADRVLRVVRVKYSRVPFECMGRVGMMVNGVEAQVLSLATMVDSIARGWAHDRVGDQSSEHKHGLATDLLWLLHRIIDDGTAVHRLDGRVGRGESVRHPLFWDIFTVLYPESVLLFAEAGLPCPGPDDYDHDGSGPAAFCSWPHAPVPECPAETGSGRSVPLWSPQASPVQDRSPSPPWPLLPPAARPPTPPPPLADILDGLLRHGAGRRSKRESWSSTSAEVGGPTGPEFNHLREALATAPA